MDINEIILSELKDLKTEIKEVRVTDIPNLRKDMAGYEVKIKAIQKQQKWSTQLHTVIGGAITFLLVKFTGHQ